MVSGGNQQHLDFSGVHNLFGPPDWFLSLLKQGLALDAGQTRKNYQALLTKLNSLEGFAPGKRLLLNSLSEAIYRLAHILQGRRAVMVSPCSDNFFGAAQAVGLQVTVLSPEKSVNPSALLSAEIKQGDIVFLHAINWFNGETIDVEAISHLAKKHAGIWFVVEFTLLFFEPSIELNDFPENVIRVQSFFEKYGISSLQLAVLSAHSTVIERCRKSGPTEDMNYLSLLAASGAVDDLTFLSRTSKMIKSNKAEMLKGVEALPGLMVLNAPGNFIFLESEKHVNLAGRLAKKNLLVYDCGRAARAGRSLVRIALRSKGDNQQLLHGLAIITGQKIRTIIKKKPAIMLLGTSSNAGKSLMAAAFCRIFARLGMKVAPFKAQNMALNSYVTADGKEMGRAQVLQAQAAMVEPDVRMNPVLIKPSSDTHSQVVQLGEPIAQLSAREYFSDKNSLRQVVHEAYDELSAENDIMVLEGAGSPAEINLKDYDIVNISMARHAQAACLLVGDIYLGGVFASFIGTLELLTPEERSFIKGFLINRFAGDQSLVTDAVDFLDRVTGLPTLGIVPFLHELNLPEEDSVNFTRRRYDDYQGDIKIGILKYPSTSNFTDFDALLVESDVSLCLVEHVSDLENLDALVLPGSKNTFRSLQFLKERKFDEYIIKKARAGTEIIGICGGFQLLGASIHDPAAVEMGQVAEEIRGLGLLPLHTAFDAKKLTAQCRGFHEPSQSRVTGYEIHHGRILSYSDCKEILHHEGRPMGLQANLFDHVWGCYLHGIFDNDVFRLWFLNRLRVRKGLPPRQHSTPYDIQVGLNRLADAVQESCDIKKILQLTGL